MANNKNEYYKVDFSKIVFAKEIIAMEEVLKTTMPVTSTSKFEFAKAEKDYDNKCVKLEISY